MPSTTGLFKHPAGGSLTINSLAITAVGPEADMAKICVVAELSAAIPAVIRRQSPVHSCESGQRAPEFAIFAPTLIFSEVCPAR
jgi:hypothetical protein